MKGLQTVRYRTTEQDTWHLLASACLHTGISMCTHMYIPHTFKYIQQLIKTNVPYVLMVPITLGTLGGQTFSFFVQGDNPQILEYWLLCSRHIVNTDRMNRLWTFGWFSAFLLPVMLQRILWQGNSLPTDMSLFSTRMDASTYHSCFHNTLGKERFEWYPWNRI